MSPSCSEPQLWLFRSYSSWVLLVSLMMTQIVAAGDASLRKHFENMISSAGGNTRSVKVAMRKGPDGKPLSMGFGFVECSSEDVAKAVLKQLQVRSCKAPVLFPLFSGRLSLICTQTDLRIFVPVMAVLKAVESLSFSEPAL